MFLYSAFHTQLWLLWLHDLGTYSKLHVVIVVSLNYTQNSEFKSAGRWFDTMTLLYSESSDIM